MTTAQRPNIVLICVDQWRGDCLNVDGHPIVQTPFLNSLALDGTRFARAYSSSPTCIAARAAMFTGLSQRTHGRVGYDDSVPWDYQTTLAGELTRAGYQTQAVGKMHVQPERAQVGFQNVILHDGFLHGPRRKNTNKDLIDDYLPWLRRELGRDADYFDHGVDCNGHVARPWDKPEYTHPTNWVTTQAMDFFRRRDTGKPFFLFVSYHRPHPPYDPPQWAFDMYVNQAMPAPPVGDWVQEFAPYWDGHRDICFMGKIDPRTLQRARAGYYGHMTHIDHQLARLYEAMEEYRVVNNTYVIFVADHGEMIGDHHMFRKGYPYEGSARVPLIIKKPGRNSDIRRNQVRDEAVELRDIMPTILDIAGVQIPQCVEGSSFLPLARGQDAAWRQYVHGEHQVLDTSIHWIVTSEEKYVWVSKTGTEQLFDLRNDPQELHNLASQPSSDGRVARWRDVLIQELSGRQEGFTDGKRLIAGRPVVSTLSHARKGS